MGAYGDIIITALLVTTACAVPGVFLILRRSAMLSDAISHSVLFGIVIAFLIVHDLSHPALIVGAAVTGLLTVGLVELLNRTGKVYNDTAIGLVFPLLFSLAVILISRYAGDVHLDTDSVLSGEIAFVSFNRFVLAGVDLGPRPAWVLGGVLLLNVLFVALFYKELKLSTFDPGLAASLGFNPVRIHYALMGLVSLTVVAAFEAVGSLLVIALLIVPAATAYLITDRLAAMLWAAVGFGVLASMLGVWGAVQGDVSISGGIVVAGGLLFLVTLFVTPGRGLLANAQRRRKQRSDFAGQLLAAHLLNHEQEGRPAEACRPEQLARDLGWTRAYAALACRNMQSRSLAEESAGRFTLTDKGRKVVQESMTR